jgi:hypothetical protein
MTYELHQIVTAYENKQRLNKLKANSTLTLSEYERNRDINKKIKDEYKQRHIPVYIFDLTLQYEENKRQLEICELEPIVDKRRLAALKSEIRIFEVSLERYFEQEEESYNEWIEKSHNEWLENIQWRPKQLNNLDLD